MWFTLRFYNNPNTIRDLKGVTIILEPRITLVNYVELKVLMSLSYNAFVHILGSFIYKMLPACFDGCPYTPISLQRLGTSNLHLPGSFVWNFRNLRNKSILHTILNNFFLYFCLKIEPLGSMKHHKFQLNLIDRYNNNKIKLLLWKQIFNNIICIVLIYVSNKK